MIATLAIAAYAPTLQIPFLWDDHVMIENNPHISGWNLQNVKHDFSADVFDHHGDNYYRPMQTLVNRMDYSLWGLRPIGYHFTNLFFHIANAILTAEIVLALGFPVLTAFVTGSLFAVHPIVVEQLMIIAGRAELMSLLFSLLTILLLTREGLATRICGWLAYLAALFSKECSVITPALLALFLHYRNEPLEKYKRVVPLILITVPYLWLHHRIAGPFLPPIIHELIPRFFIQEFPHVTGRYLALLLIPWNLHSHRLLPHLSHFWGLFLALFAGFSFYIVHKFGRLGAFCLGWFILALLPKTPVMIFGNFMLDHWAYAAALAVLLPIAILVTKGWISQNKGIQYMVGCFYFGLLIAWALLVHLNVALRGTDEKMYRWALHFTTSNPIKYNLSVLLLQTGRPAEAAAYLEDYRAYYPEDLTAGNTLALAYWKSGHPWLAAHILEVLARNHPGDAMTQKHLAMIRRALRRPK